MLQSQRVADLVGRELSKPVQRQTEHGVVILTVPLVHLRREARIRIRRHQTLAQQIILSHASRSERDVSVQDFAGRRVLERATLAPSPRFAVHPLDYVDAKALIEPMTMPMKKSGSFVNGSLWRMR